jgi:hypothetical protein
VRKWTRDLAAPDTPAANVNRDGRRRLQHQARHRRLHTALDELVADFLFHHPSKRLRGTTVMELMLWSHRQTVEPSEKT